jgi:hypothetical protein
MVARTADKPTANKRCSISPKGKSLRTSRRRNVFERTFGAAEPSKIDPACLGAHRNDPNHGHDWEIRRPLGAECVGADVGQGAPGALPHPMWGRAGISLSGVEERRGGVG